MEKKYPLQCPKIIFFVAMEEERDKIITPALQKLGLLGRDDIWVVVTGIGKVNAALSASKALFTCLAFYGDELKNCTCINVGVCGGSPATVKRPTVKVGISAEADFDVSAFLPDYKHTRFQLSKSYSICLTQDHVCTKIRELPIDSDTVPYFIDMELYSLAKACLLYKTKLISIKSVSDIVGNKAQKDEFESNFELACKRAEKLLENTIKTSTNVILN